jgi:glycerol-3-phosphate acyltransferase PlsY
MTFLQVLLLLTCYLSGSVPFGYLLTRRTTGLNILEQGSKNIGSTNVTRIAGKKTGTIVQILDMAKGLIPVSLIYSGLKHGIISAPDYFIFLSAFLTVIGHDFSLFLGFRGGKGVNTTLGATLILAPWAVLASVLVYFALKRLSGYVSAGSISLALTLFSSSLILYSGDIYLIVYVLAASALILVRHIPNLKRLLAGKELH